MQLTDKLTLIEKLQGDWSKTVSNMIPVDGNQRDSICIPK